MHRPPILSPAWIVSFLLVVLASASAAQTVRVKAPALSAVPKDRTHELRALYLEDPRLPTLDLRERQELFSRLEQTVRDQYGYEVRFREIGRTDLAGYFAAHAGVFQKHAGIVRMRLDPALDHDREVIRGLIQRTTASLPLARIRDDLGTDELSSRDRAVTVAVQHFLGRLREIQSLRLPDGTTVADRERPELNSYMHWCALTHEMEEADIVFTNSIIVGADAEMPWYVIRRGGVTTGNVNANRHNAFGATAVITLFPLLSEAPFWLRERGPIPAAERLDVIITLAMHELGHLLLRVAEHSHPHCIHSACAGLRYYDWHVAIRDSRPCPLPHEKLSHY